MKNPVWLQRLLRDKRISTIPCSWADGLFEMMEYDYRPIEWHRINNGYVRFLVAEYPKGEDDPPVYTSLIVDSQEDFWAKVVGIILAIEKREAL